MALKFKYRLFSFLGAPVYLHVTFLLVYIFFLERSNGDWSFALLSGTTFLCLMLAHEMGHAYFVRKYQHDLTGIKIYPIHGQCEYEIYEEWEPETLIIAGGLIAQILLLIFWFVFINGIQFLGFVYVESLLYPITRVLIDLNILILILNSLPIPGLDGYELWRRFGSYIATHLKRFRTKENNRPKPVPTNNQDSPEKIVDLALKRIQKRKK